MTAALMLLGLAAIMAGLSVYLVASSGSILADVHVQVTGRRQSGADPVASASTVEPSTVEPRPGRLVSLRTNHKDV